MAEEVELCVEIPPNMEDVWEEALDVDRLCRACANTNESMIPIFEGDGIEHELQAKIAKHLPVKITKEDGLPHQMCFQCASTLVAWHDMFTNCIEAEKKLTNLVNKAKDAKDDEQELQEMEEMEEQVIEEEVIETSIAEDMAIEKFTTDVQERTVREMEMDDDNREDDVEAAREDDVEGIDENSGKKEDRAGTTIRDQFRVMNKDETHTIKMILNMKEMRLHLKSHYLVNARAEAKKFITRVALKLAAKKYFQSGNHSLAVNMTSDDDKHEDHNYDGRNDEISRDGNDSDGEISRDDEVSRDDEEDIELDIDLSKYPSLSEGRYSCKKCKCGFDSLYRLKEHLIMQFKECCDKDKGGPDLENYEVLFPKKDEIESAPVGGRVREQDSLQCEKCNDKIVDIDGDFEFDRDPNLDEARFLCKKCNCGFKRLYDLKQHLIMQFKECCDKQKGGPDLENYEVLFPKKDESESAPAAERVREPDSLQCEKCKHNRNDEISRVKFDDDDDDDDDDDNGDVELNNYDFSRDLSVEEGRFSCKKCKRKFNSLYHLKQHLIMKFKECCDKDKGGPELKNYEALFSKKKPSNDATVVKELKKVDYLQCEKCGKMFYYRDAFRSHMRCHELKEKVECRLCRKEFSKSGIKYHMKFVHNLEVRRHKCDDCGKVFATKGLLVQHTRTHTGETPFACPICGARKRALGDLRKHILTHGTERPYCCESESCNASFKTSHQLKRHSMVHNLERRYMCDICGKSFLISYHLKRHKFTHSEVKPFICSLCSADFSQRRYLNTHMRKKHNIQLNYGKSNETYLTEPETSAVSQLSPSPND